MAAIFGPAFSAQNANCPAGLVRAWAKLRSVNLVTVDHYKLWPPQLIPKNTHQKARPFED
jgi:hypothetical protein